MLRPILNNDVLTLVLVSIVGLLAIVSLLNVKRFSSYLSILINSTYLSTYSKDVKLFDRFNFLLFIAFTLSISVLLAVLNYKFGFIQNVEWFDILIGVVLFFGLKIVIELILGKLLESYQFFKYVLFRKLSYNFFLIFLIVPLSGLFLYNCALPNNVIYYGIILLLTLYVFMYFIVIRFYLDVVKQYLFYFILYLCALEIAPCLILYRFVL